MAKYYTGLDVSMDQTDIATVNEKGKPVFEGTSKTDPINIDAVLKRAGFPIEKISLESGSWSHWLIKEMLALGWNITCIDARSISPLLSLKTNKTDRNDARGIAEAVRTDSQYIREVYHKSQISIDLGTYLTARRLLVGQKTALGNAMRGLLKSFGVKIGSSTAKNLTTLICLKIQEQWTSEENTKIEGGLSQKKYPVLALEALITLFNGLESEINKIDSVLTKLARKDLIVKQLMTVPGIGYLTAITYKVLIDNPKRFKNPRMVGAYLGMCPKQYSSGQTKRQGRISKRGSKELRTLLASAGMKLLTHCKKTSDLRTWGLKIAEKHGKKKASMAIGRKIAIIMHRIWSNGTPFNPEKNKT